MKKVRKISHSTLTYEMELLVNEHIQTNIAHIPNSELLDDFLAWLNEDDDGELFYDKYFVDRTISVITPLSADPSCQDVDELSAPYVAGASQSKSKKATSKKKGFLGKIADAVIGKKTASAHQEKYSDFISFLEAERETFDWLVGGDVDRLIAIIARRPLYPYQAGWYRKSLRSFRLTDHADAIRKVFGAIINANYVDLTNEQLLTTERDEEGNLIFGYTNTFSELFAYELERGNKEFRQALEDCITSENTTDDVSYDIIRAVFMSQNQQLLELIKKLLNAAQRQEGLRQAILERADEGRVENLFPILKLIKGENLIRFSSVKRAVGTWTGYFDEENADRMTGKEIDYLIECFESTKNLEAALTGKNSLKALIGLYVIGNYNVERAIRRAKEMLKVNEKHIRMVAAYFLTSYANPDTKATIEAILDNRELPIVTVLSSSLFRDAGRNVIGDLSYKFPSFDKLNELDLGYTASRVFERTNGTPQKFEDFFSSTDQAVQLFELFENIVKENKGTIVVKNTPFEGVDMSRDSGNFVEHMICTALFLRNQTGKAHEIGMELVERSFEYVDHIDSYQRVYYKYGLVFPLENAVLRERFFDMFKDRLVDVKKIAFAMLPFVDNITDDELKDMADCYRYKSAELRVDLTTYFSSIEPSRLLPILEHLLSSGKQDVRLGGLDILLNLRGNPGTESVYNESVKFLDLIKKPTAKEQLLIDQCCQELTAVDKPGFGIYDPEKPFSTIELPKPSGVKLYEDFTMDDVRELVQNAIDFVAEHADVEYEGDEGRMWLFGDASWPWRYIRSYEEQKTAKTPIDKLYVQDLYKTFISKYLKDLRLLELYGFCTDIDDDDDLSEENQDRPKIEVSSIERILLGGDFEKIGRNDYRGVKFSEAAFAFLNALRTVYNGEIDGCRERYRDIFLKLFEIDPDRLVGLYREYRRDVYQTFARQSTVYNKIEDAFNDLKRLKTLDKKTFSEEFSLLWNLRKHIRKNTHPDHDGTSGVGIKYPLLFAAIEYGLISDNDYYKYLFEGGKGDSRMFEFLAVLGGYSPSNLYWTKETEYCTDGAAEIAKRLYLPLEKVIVESELKRGDSPTSISSMAVKISKVVGADYFVQIIVALGKEKLQRSSYYYWYAGSEPSKKEGLSALLRCSHPADGEDEETLKKLFKEYNIEPSLSRLTEIAVYSAGWQAILEKLTGINGLVEGCLFFRAHNAEIDERYEAEIARMTPIPIEDLKAGAFDVNWFHKVYDELGEENLNLIYDAAKYITDGATHTRARKFVDAMLGRYDLDETEETIRDKRNKDLLLAYALIPLPRYTSGAKKGQPKPDFTKDLVRRYQFLQDFLKSSKQFGAQRQASEAEVVKVALRNLATNAGYADVTRMMWQVETDLFAEMEHLFATHEVDDYRVTLAADDLGRCDITVENDKGKSLKSIPSKIKKNPLIQELRDAKKVATDQWRRSRKALELSMENEDCFMLEELKSISSHPILLPLLSQLVLGVVTEGDEKSGFKIGVSGFFNGETDSLEGLDTHKLSGDEKLVIAHPVHLFQSGKWHDWQKIVFDGKRTQPFKQVFRELYVPTKDEKDALDSRRYAGHQIQPKVAVGTLKNRLWVVDPEEGLQKIDYKRGIIATIYAMADWFSPSDIEPPTLEWVVFYDRAKSERVKLSDVSPVLFSETMRDVDLVVSVAHAGNVDPQASHSTIEMRRALLELSLPLFKLKNVKLKEAHAIIEGSRAEYSIHLGSGVIHQVGGPQIAVLAVQSQARGRIFLPFVDDDPKTAEIISKVLMFADDKKIKDPSILDQIVPKK